MDTPKAVETRPGWFFGPAPDLLFGCGLLYMGLFALQCLAGASMRRWLPLEMAPFLALLLGTPHYGATLQRVYGSAEDRRRYGFLTVCLSVALVAVYIAGLHSLALGSLLVTLYFTWSPWHYTGQNYGVALLFLHQRGVPVGTAAKRLLQASFRLSYVLVFLNLQSAASRTLHSPGNYQGTVFDYLALGIPRAWILGLAILCLVLYAAALAACALLLLKGAPARALGPAATVVLMQALWFLLPAVAIVWRRFAVVDPLEPAFRPYAIQWIAMGHFIQYLWIATYRASEGTQASAKGAYLVKCLLAGVAMWTLPPLIFAPWVPGPLPLDMGLGLLTASVVNFHHFILDGVVWKSRPGPVARLFMAEPRETRPGPLPSFTRRSGVRALAWGVGTACALIALVSNWEQVSGFRALRKGDIPRAELALRRLALLGQDSPKIRLALAELHLRTGAPDAALAHLQRSLTLWPTADAWAFLARWYERAGEWDEAREAYEKAVELAPRRSELRERLEQVRARTGDRSEDARQDL